MAFGFFRKKNTAAEEPSVERTAASRRADGVEELLSICEDYGNLARNLADTKREYAIVTEYLSDCETIAALPPERLAVIQSTAEMIDTLNGRRDEYMNRPRRISDAKMHEFDMRGDEIPDAINRLIKDEKYQDTLKRDMGYLEGEKLRWVLNRSDMFDEMKKLRIASFVVLGIFGACMLAMMIMSLGFDMELNIFFVVAAFIALAAGLIIIVRYQNDIMTLKIAGKNADKAIAMLNKVKIKYVNITNAVEYERNSFQVKDSREFLLQWEDYQEAVREREKFKDANTDLEIYTKRLMKLLSELDLYDSGVWLDMPSVLYRTGDMVERRHELFVKRQKLRDQLNSYIDAMNYQRKDIKRLLNKYPEYAGEVGDILTMADELIKK